MSESGVAQCRATGPAAAVAARIRVGCWQKEVSPAEGRKVKAAAVVVVVAAAATGSGRPPGGRGRGRGVGAADLAAAGAASPAIAAAAAAAAAAVASTIEWGSMPGMPAAGPRADHGMCWSGAKLGLGPDRHAVAPGPPPAPASATAAGGVPSGRERALIRRGCRSLDPLGRPGFRAGGKMVGQMPGPRGWTGAGRATADDGDGGHGWVGGCCGGGGGGREGWWRRGAEAVVAMLQSALGYRDRLHGDVQRQRWAVPQRMVRLEDRRIVT
jgi:hypothetical protein